LISHHISEYIFIIKASKFIDKTSEHVLQGINPGGIYQTTWCRDAAYILKDWFLSGNIDGTIQQIYQIWSHQITSQGAVGLVESKNVIYYFPSLLQKVIHICMHSMDG
jgi:hypothetical protein